MRLTADLNEPMTTLSDGESRPFLIAVSSGNAYPQPGRLGKPERGTSVLTFNEHNTVEVIGQQREFIDHHPWKVTGNIDPAVRYDLADGFRDGTRRLLHRPYHVSVGRAATRTKPHPAKPPGPSV